MNTTKVIAIPVQSKLQFDKNIDSLKKLAKKLGKPEPTIHTSKFYKYTKVVASEDSDPVSFIFDVFDCTIDLEETLKLDGEWSIIGKNDHVNDYVYMIDADREITKQYTPENYTCEHCNTNHNKSKSFILESNVTGELKQVGSSCLRKFIEVNPESFISMLSMLKETIDAISSSNNFTPNMNHKAVSLDLIWTLAHNQVQEDGEYVKPLYYEEENNRYCVKIRSNSGLATYEKVSKNLSNFNGDINLEICSKIREYLSTIKPKIISVYQGDDDENGEKIYFDEDVTSDYLKLIMKFKDVKNCIMMELPLVVSIYKSYLGHLKELARLEAAKNLSYFGTVGEKIALKLQIKMIKFIENQWGGSYLYKLENESGNKFTKFGTINEKFIVDGEKIEEGCWIQCLAEVKTHEEYHDEKQTVLGRLSKIK